MSTVLWIVNIMVAFSVIMIIYAVVIAVVEAKKNKKEKEEQYKKARRNWKMRAKELGFSPTGKSKVYCKYGNCDDFYPVYVWVENGKLWNIVVEPTVSTASNNVYTYPENIRKTYFGDIRRIYRTGSQGEYSKHDFSHAEAMDKKADFSASSIQRLYYRKKALDATIHAPSHTVKYDNRRTIIEADNGPFEFRIDAYDVFKELVPDKC